jgi:hypothetical protein
MAGITSGRRLPEMSCGYCSSDRFNRARPSPSSANQHNAFPKPYDKGVSKMAKNPWMSAYLSAANRVANTARGHATNEVKRQSKKQTTSMMNAWVDAWTPKTTRKRKSR